MEAEEGTHIQGCSGCGYSCNWYISSIIARVAAWQTDMLHNLRPLWLRTE